MKVLNLNTTPQDELIAEAIKVLDSGGLVVYPTETCYGIGADASSEFAITSLLDFKGNRGNKPISIMVNRKEMAANYVQLNEIAHNIYNTLLPGPVTVISKYKGQGIDTRLISDKNTLGVRVSSNQFVRELVLGYKKPITATSANSSNQPSPYSLELWRKYTPAKSRKMVQLFIDGGKLPYNPPSTIVDTTVNSQQVLRQGEVIFDNNEEEIFLSKSLQDTFGIAYRLMDKFKAELQEKGLVLALMGEMGVGKTHFTKGVAKALGYAGLINSPTYTLAKEYEYQKDKWLYHIDAWRLKDDEKLTDLGFLRMLKPGNVVVIEWVQKVKNEIKMVDGKVKVLWLMIEEKSANERLIKVK